MTTDPKPSSRPPVTAAGVPKYDGPTVDLIHRFLASIYGDYQYKLERLRADWADMLNHPLCKGQIDYCLHAMGALRWAAYRATRGQKHLLEFTDQDLQELRQQWEEHYPTCDSTGPSVQ